MVLYCFEAKLQSKYNSPSFSLHPPFSPTSPLSLFSPVILISACKKTILLLVLDREIIVQLLNNPNRQTHTKFASFGVVLILVWHSCVLGNKEADRESHDTIPAWSAAAAGPQCKSHQFVISLCHCYTFFFSFFPSLSQCNWIPALPTLVLSPVFPWVIPLYAFFPLPLSTLFQFLTFKSHIWLFWNFDHFNSCPYTYIHTCIHKYTLVLYCSCLSLVLYLKHSISTAHIWCLYLCIISGLCWIPALITQQAIVIDANKQPMYYVSIC